MESYFEQKLAYYEQVVKYTKKTSKLKVAKRKLKTYQWWVTMLEKHRERYGGQ